MAFSLGADFFYYVDPAIAIGFGVDHIFNSEVKDGEGKIGYTNIYAQVKPVIDLENDIFNNIYFLGQIGYGLMYLDVSYDLDNSNGIYWSIGVGTTIKENFIVELLYSCAYGDMEGLEEDWLTGDIKKVTLDTTYSTIKLNVGYKFSL